MRVVLMPQSWVWCLGQTSEYDTFAFGNRNNYSQAPNVANALAPADIALPLCGRHPSSADRPGPISPAHALPLPERHLRTGIQPSF